ncbi:MAG: hypothetical protein ACR2JP_03245 [Acidimicrobiia bacterium]
MRTMRAFGIQQLFSGLRRGSPGLSGIGAALALIGWMRDRRGPSKERLYARNLREGETLKVRLVRGGAVVDETDVVG